MRLLPSSIQNCLLGLAAALFVTGLLPTAHAQFSNPSAPPTTQVRDASALKPPPGAKVAIIEFEDLECPDCARANPLLKDAATQYHIPWVRHDFPLPFHGWSTEAAINARWFDTKSKKIGDEYRDQVFASQNQITTLNSDQSAEDGAAGLAKLRAFTEQFAKSHGLALPFVMDPQGKLKAEVKTDYALGQRIGIEHTPTIWVVTNRTNGVPFVEVLDRSKLYSMIEEAQAETKSSSTGRPKPVQ
jgi:protein-disulfide isomerase